MISSQALGERIAHARKRLKLTQAELAARMGMSRTTLVAIEKGERRPSNEEVVRLAPILETSLHDLLRESAVLADPAPRFRMPRATDPSSQALVDAVEHLRKLSNRYVELENLLGERREPAPLEALRTYRHSEGSRQAPAREGEDAARTLRSLFGLGDAPALALDKRLEAEAGFRIFYIEMPPAVGGIFLWSEELGPCVAINAKHPIERQRWSILHETGHFLRDRELGDIFSEGDEKSRDASEMFAESLAGSFLLPAGGVSRHFAEKCRMNSGKFSAVDILSLARFYEVSFQAMALRLEELRLLRAGTYERLAAHKISPRQIEDQSGLRRAPQYTPQKFPERYQRLAFLAFKEDEIGEGDLAEILESDRVGAREMYHAFRQVELDDGRRIELELGREDLSAP